MFLGCAPTRPVVPQVVMIRAINHDPVVSRDSQALKLCEQLGFAEVAAIGGILPVCGVVQFLGFDLQVVESELLDETGGFLLLKLGIRGADRRDTKSLVAQDPICHIGQIGAIDPSAKADNDALHVA